MMQQETSKVLWNQTAGGGSVYRIGLSGSGHYEDAAPGQFATLHLPGETTPLLRRPFSIHRRIRSRGRVEGVEILYKAVGEFTRKLSRAAAGEAVDLLGPLGRGFTVPPGIGSAVLVAGGIGVAPMVFLAESLLEAGASASASAVCLGGKTAADILCRTDFQRLGLPVLAATEDGSTGEKGLVTRVLEARLAEAKPEMVYACGPMPMLRKTAAIAARHSLPCEISVETLMACGVGACLGCAIKDREHANGYGHVCIDGPVFAAPRLAPEQEEEP
jgi:dihydroorotate dehydrogenase electron transfer subunit